MAPDEVMVYSSVALVPLFSGLVGLLTLRAVRKNTLSAIASCLAFVAAVPAGMLMSLGVVNAFSHLLHGDGAMAIVAAPVMGAMLTIPVALIFVVALVVIKSRHA